MGWFGLTPSARTPEADDAAHLTCRMVDGKSVCYDGTDYLVRKGWHYFRYDITAAERKAFFLLARRQRRSGAAFEDENEHHFVLLYRRLPSRSAPVYVIARDT